MSKEYNKDVADAYKLILNEYMQLTSEDLKKLSPSEKLLIYAVYLNLKKVGLI